MTSIACVIVNYKNYQITLDCLRSIERANKKNLDVKIVLVDSLSDTGKAKLFKKYNPLIYKENLGFAKGNNIGIKEALKTNPDFVLLVNNDTIIEKNFFQEIAVFVEKHSEPIIVSPKIYFAKGFEFHKNRYEKNNLGKVIWSAGGAIDWDNVIGLNRGVDEVDVGQYGSPQKISFATGACMLIDTKIIKQIGMLDEKYFLYLEDLDFCVRAQKNKFDIWYCPGGIIWHKVSSSSGIGSSLNDYYISRNRMLFGMKYTKLRTKLALFRESIKLLFSGRSWQRIGIRDFYLLKFGKGSWK